MLKKNHGSPRDLGPRPFIIILILKTLNFSMQCACYCHSRLLEGADITKCFGKPAYAPTPLPVLRVLDAFFFHESQKRIQKRILIWPRGCTQVITLVVAVKNLLHFFVKTTVPHTNQFIPPFRGPVNVKVCICTFFSSIFTRFDNSQTYIDRR